MFLNLCLFLSQPGFETNKARPQPAPPDEVRQWWVLETGSGSRRGAWVTRQHEVAAACRLPEGKGISKSIVQGSEPAPGRLPFVSPVIWKLRLRDEISRREDNGTLLLP